MVGPSISSLERQEEERRTTLWSDIEPILPKTQKFTAHISPNSDVKPK